MKKIKAIKVNEDLHETGEFVMLTIDSKLEKIIDNLRKLLNFRHEEIQDYSSKDYIQVSNLINEKELELKNILRDLVYVQSEFNVSEEEYIYIGDFFIRDQPKEDLIFQFSFGIFENTTYVNTSTGKRLKLSHEVVDVEIKTQNGIREHLKVKEAMDWEAIQKYTRAILILKSGTMLFCNIDCASRDNVVSFVVPNHETVFVYERGKVNRILIEVNQ